MSNTDPPGGAPRDLFRFAIQLIVILLVIALVWWVVTMLPLPPFVGTVVMVLLALVAILWIARYFGVF